MKKYTGLSVILLLAFAVVVLTRAGDLSPPGPPAPTMVTLQQIHDKMDECTVGGRCIVQKTGQTECWDAAGDPIDCAGTGQDGEYQAGVALAQRFTDNGDGTVSDNLTGLIWLQDARCLGEGDWDTLVSGANGLADGECGLTDDSAPGDWRIPNVREFISVVDFDEWLIGPPAGHPFVALPAFPGYRTSTNSARFPDHSWVVIPGGGQVNLRVKSDLFLGWPVRGAL